MACRAAGAGTPSAAARAGPGVDRADRPAHAGEVEIGYAGGTAERIAVVGTGRRRGLGGRRAVGSRRSRRATEGIAAWGLEELVCVLR